MGQLYTSSIRNWFGWMSTNDHTGSVGQYAFGTDVDHESHFSGIALADKLKTVGTVAEKPVVGVDNYFITQTGEFYEINSSDTITARGSMNATVTDVQNMVSWKGLYHRIYKKSGENFARMAGIATQATDNGDWQDQINTNSEDYSEDYGSLGSGSEYVPAIVRNNSLYVGGENRVYEVEKTDADPLWTLATFTFNTVLSGLTGNDRTVTGLTAEGNFIKVYQRSGTFMHWDGVSPNPDAVTDGQRFARAVIDTGAFDYVIGGVDARNTDFYATQAYSVQEIGQSKQSKIIPSAHKFTIGWDYDLNRDFWTAYYRGEVYTIDSISKSIVVYGRQQPNLPQSYRHLASKNSQWHSFQEIYGLWRDGTRLYIMHKANDEYRIDYIEFDKSVATTYPSQWDIYSLVYTAGEKGASAYTKQTVKEFNIKADIPVGTSIVIKYAKDCWQWGVETFNTLFTLSDSTQMHHRVFAPEFVVDRVDIMFKMELVTTDETKTPVLYEFNFLYSINEE